MWTTSTIAIPPAEPIVCQRSSSSTTRSRYDTAFGSSKIRAAVSNDMPCFRRLVRFFLSSHAKTMRIYRIVALLLWVPLRLCVQERRFGPIARPLVAAGFNLSSVRVADTPEGELRVSPNPVRRSMYDNPLNGSVSETTSNARPTPAGPDGRHARLRGLHPQTRRCKRRRLGTPEAMTRDVRNSFD